MRVMVIYNPISGRGRSSQLATAIAARLVRDPLDVEMIQTKREDPSEWLLPRLKVKPDSVVVVGGDGTLRQVASVLVDTKIPLYHAACGTENLFAKSMHMSSEPEDIANTIERRALKSIDTATAKNQFMILMASVGFDADVIAKLAASRGSSITHLSYVIPTLQSFLSFNPPVISITVDGESIVDQVRGWAVVANSRAYARGLNPAKDALVDDGDLDLVFLPLKGRLSLLKWIRLLKKGTHLHHLDAVHGRGKKITVKTNSPAQWQIDGDVAGKHSVMELTVNQDSLEVLQQTVTVDDSTGDSSN